MKKQTLAIDFPFQRKDAYNALSMPVYHSASYEFDDAARMADAFCGKTDDPDYSRLTNPTVIYFENKVKALTGAADVIAVNSGMAAISNALFSVASAGKNIVSSRHLFGNSVSLVGETLPRFGVEARLRDLTDLEAVEKALDGNTCCIFLEIITNPQLEVADLEAVCDIAHRHGVPVLADTTVIPFTEFSAKDLGVDVEIVSSTKYLSVGGTAIGGLVIDYGTLPGFGKTVREEVLRNLGAYMNPDTAFLQNLGLETLEIRYKVQAANALYLAKRLRTLPSLRKVNYVGLEDHPNHGLAMRLYGGTAGAVLTIDLEDEAACYRFINALKLVRRATNLFDNKTLAIHPYSTIFGPFPPEKRLEMDVFPTTVRISVGLEDMDDIFEDIRQAAEK